MQYKVPWAGCKWMQCPDFMTCMQFYTAQQRIERFDAEHERIKAQRGGQEESQVRLTGWTADEAERHMQLACFLDNMQSCSPCARGTVHGSLWATSTRKPATAHAIMLPVPNGQPEGLAGARQSSSKLGSDHRSAA